MIVGETRRASSRRAGIRDAGVCTTPVAFSFVHLRRRLTLRCRSKARRNVPDSRRWSLFPTPNFTPGGALAQGLEFERLHTYGVHDDHKNIPAPISSFDHWTTKKSRDPYIQYIGKGIYPRNLALP